MSIQRWVRAPKAIPPLTSVPIVGKKGSTDGISGIRNRANQTVDRCSPSTDSKTPKHLPSTEVNFPSQKNTTTGLDMVDCESRIDAQWML